MAIFSIYDKGASPEIDEYGWLCCPNCGGDYLHQERTRVYERTWGEDGDGTLTTVSRGQTTIEPVKSKEMPDRRNSIAIEFSCENCGHDEVIDEKSGRHVLAIAEMRQVLVIEQHKGNTYIYWAAPIVLSPKVTELPMGSNL